MGHIKGKINYYDFVSMYGALMSVNNYPIGKMNIINIDEKDRNIYKREVYGENNWYLKLRKLYKIHNINECFMIILKRNK